MAKQETEDQELIRLAKKATLKALRGQDPGVPPAWIGHAIKLAKGTGNTADDDPLHSAIMESLDKARREGDKMPPMSTDDDSATQPVRL